MNQLNTPIGFIIFKRPEYTARVFERIREQKPKHLLIIADGPRHEVSGEYELCMAARKVVEKIDWPCEVVRDYSDVNMGCGRRPATGIKRLFELHEEAIVLEDDCLPDPTFFRYCEELLEKYRNTPSVMAVGGHRFNSLPSARGESYSFCSFATSTGWASWRRAWTGYDFEMTDWPHEKAFLKEKNLKSTAWKNIFWKEQWWERLVKNYDGATIGDKPHAWDYQFWYHMMKQDGCCTIPSVNLVVHLGFDEHSVHFSNSGGILPHFPKQSHPMSFPMNHPRNVEIDWDFSRRSYLLNFFGMTPFGHLKKTFFDDPIRSVFWNAYWKIQPQIRPLIRILFGSKTKH